MAATTRLRHGIPRVSAGRWAGLLLCAACALADGLLLGDRSVPGTLGLLLLLLPAALLLATGTTARSTLRVAPVLSGLLACGLLGLALATGRPAAYAATAAAVLLVPAALAAAGRRRSPAEPLSAADREDLLDAYPALAAVPAGARSAHAPAAAAVPGPRRSPRDHQVAS
ncbi:hypothetical protein [Kitasatospora sp. NPDC002040]|uniref:hypothetical protein n=1 Tax=Kitasatospora sp. NPDC002040 TaxID=3154661 RepID=UPI003332E69D